MTLTEFQKKLISSFPRLKPLVKAHRDCALKSPDSVKAKELTTHFFIREIDQLCPRNIRVAYKAVVLPIPLFQDSSIPDARLEGRGYIGLRSLLNAMIPAYA